MPSGAKKRKAAKKKNREIQSSNNNHSYGYEDVKSHQHQTEDDAGEASSQGLRIGSGEKNVTVEKNVEREFTIEDDESDRKDGSTEPDDSTRNSYNGGSSGGSSRSNSSSDDESHDTIKNGQAAGDSSSTVDSVKVADPVSNISSKSIHIAPIEEDGDLVVGKIPTVDSVKISALSEQLEVGISSPADISKENGVKKQSYDEIEVGKSLALYPKECGRQEIDDRLALPYNEPADNRVEPEKDYGVNEPLLVPSPPAVQKASWKSCCGLFEMFSGSGS